MSNNVQVNFRVSGGELTNYMDRIKQKQQQQTDTAVAGAVRQTDKAKEQNKLVEQQINLIQQRSRLELQAERNLLNEQRKRELSHSNSGYDAKADAVYNNRRLTDTEREKRLKVIDKDRKNDESYIRNKYRDMLDENTGDQRGLQVENYWRKQKEAEDKKLAAEEVEKRRAAYGTGKADFSVTAKNVENYTNRRKNKGSQIFNDALQSSMQQNVQGRVHNFLVLDH